MFGLNSSMQFYVYNGFVDMRKSFDGLCGLVYQHMNLDACSGGVFVFVNKRKDKLKLLRWEVDGFVLYYKRLEVGSFEFAFLGQQQGGQAISYGELAMVLQGLRADKIVQKKRYKLAIRQ
jgi:transposase